MHQRPVWLHEVRGRCTNCVNTTDAIGSPQAILLHCETPFAHQSGILAVQTCDSRFQRADTSAADGHEAWSSAGHFDQFVVARPPIADHAIDVDDVATMHADEMPLIEARFNVANGERAKQFVVAVENVRVVRVGMDRDHLLHGEKMRMAVALDRQMSRKAPR